jgi:AcrR family transcriptional regulator
VLIQRGYEGLRYRDVAQQAGVPVASLQHYFPNLADLRREALLHQVHTEVSALSADLDGIADPWAKLRHIVSSTVEVNPGQRRGEWMLWLEYWRAAAHDPEIAADNRVSEQALRGMVAAAIEEGAGSGTFKPVAEPQTIALTMLALIDGFGIQLAIDDAEGDAENSVKLIEAYARMMLQVDAEAPSFQAGYSRLA